MQASQGKGKGKVKEREEEVEEVETGDFVQRSKFMEVQDEKESRIHVTSKVMSSTSTRRESVKVSICLFRFSIDLVETGSHFAKVSYKDCMN